MGEVDEALREVGRHDRARAACLPADVAAIKGFEISYIWIKESKKGFGIKAGFLTGPPHIVKMDTTICSQPELMSHENLNS